MNRARDELLAGAAPARDHYVAGTACKKEDLLAEPPDRRRLSDDPVRVGLPEGESGIGTVLPREMARAAATQEQQKLSELQQVSCSDLALDGEFTVFQKRAPPLISRNVSAADLTERTLKPGDGACLNRRRRSPYSRALLSDRPLDRFTRKAVSPAGRH